MANVKLTKRTRAGSALYLNTLLANNPTASQLQNIWFTANTMGLKLVAIPVEMEVNYDEMGTDDNSV